MVTYLYAPMDKLKKSLAPILIAAGVSGILASMGDFMVTSILGSLYPGYSFIHRPESYLGTSDSPVALYMNTWGLVFCFLLIFFAWGLRSTIFRYGRWQTLIVALVVLYGLGEGAGSGLFPYNHVNNVLTLSGKLHSVFGALGGVAIVSIPFAGIKIFSKESFPRLHAYSKLVLIAGLILTVVFLVSDRDVISYRGLWQRIYLFNYHFYLSVLAMVMLKQKTLAPVNK